MGKRQRLEGGVEGGLGHGGRGGGVGRLRVRVVVEGGGGGGQAGGRKEGRGGFRQVERPMGEGRT